MSEKRPAVELRGVTKRFGAFTAVAGVDLAISPGEFLTLLGPSGCGKTTLLRMIAGFETPDAGAVWLHGQEVTALPPYRRDVNQVFQGYALFPHLSVWENIAFGLRRQGLPAAEINQRTMEAISLVSLEGCEPRMPHQLSGGQRQRVALARALAPRPSVLLLDEPLSALDAKLRQAMQLELKRLQRQLGLTFVFVTHDQQEALVMSDRIAIVHRGRIEQTGTPTQVYEHPANPFVAEFVGETNLLQFEVISRDATSVYLRVGGSLPVVFPAAAIPGNSHKGLLSIRPEKLHLSAVPLTGGVSFRARTEEEVYKGPVKHLVLVTDAGLKLMAVVTNQGALGPSLPLGGPVFCGFHPQDVRVLPSTS